MKIKLYNNQLFQQKQLDNVIFYNDEENLVKSDRSQRVMCAPKIKKTCN